MRTIRVASTASGVTLDALGDGRYRLCDATCGCVQVKGLWRAEELMRHLDLGRFTVSNLAAHDH